MRNKILNLKVSEDELADVKKRAGSRKVSEYVRGLIFPEDVEQRENGQVTLADANFEADRVVQNSPQRFEDVDYRNFAHMNKVSIEEAFEALEGRKR